MPTTKLNINSFASGQILFLMVINVDTILDTLFSSGYMPHGACFLWQPAVLWLHVISDSIIILSYYSIPFALFYFVRKRRDFQYPWILSLFGAFILLCGTTHVLAVWTIWEPVYWLSGIIKAATALVSAMTAVLVWPLLPKLLALPSPSQLVEKNKELESSIENHLVTEKELKKFSMAVSHSSSMVLIVNRDLEIEYCNPSFCEVTGFDEEEVVGSRTNLLGCHKTAGGTSVADAINSLDCWQGEFSDFRKNGDQFWCFESISPIRNEQGQITHYVTVSHDITERKRTDETIKRLALFDSLTNLPNRALFKDRLQQAKLTADRNKQSFALLYLDLDNFKKINDSLGHPVGDQLLISVGERLQGKLRNSDTIARLGGDEFAIILPGIENPTQIDALSEGIIDLFADGFSLEGQQLTITTSIGVSVYPDSCEDIDQLVKQADSALYVAKDQGRHCFEIYSEDLAAQSAQRAALESELISALQNGEFLLDFQPKLDIHSNRITGVEALIRWRHPERGILSPMAFIPLAEETGLIVSIGEWVVRSTCEQIKQWQKDFNRSVRVAVNISGRQFRENDLVSKIETIVSQAGIAPSLLEIEITESTIIEKPDQAVENLNALREGGIQLSIDDFGTGYSSLSYLKRFPVHTLKIDRSFVRDLEHDPDDACIVAAVIALAHGLGLRVIAEGVENRAQLDFLKSYKCDEIQGYLVAPPVSGDELMGLPIWNDQMTSDDRVHQNRVLLPCC